MTTLPSAKYLAIIASSIIGFWIANLLIVLWAFRFTVPEPGQIGDIFGASNSLFTGLGLLALAVTLFQQSQQIRSASESSKLNAKLAVLPILIEDLKTNISHRDPAVDRANLSIAKCEEMIRRTKPGKSVHEQAEYEALINDLRQLIQALTELRAICKFDGHEIRRNTLS